MTTVKRVDKKLLLNHVRHASSHNKVQEERDMWIQREKEKKREKERRRERDDWSVKASVTTDLPLVRGRLVSDTVRYSDSPSLSPSPPSQTYYSDLPHHHKSRDSRPSNYWTRELMKAEEADPFRWGHSGYKEQHPEEFTSTQSSEDGATKMEPKKKKKKKKLKIRTLTKRESKKRRKKKAKTAVHSSDENTSVSSTVSEESRRRERRKKRRKEKRMLKKKRQKVPASEQ